MFSAILYTFDSEWDAKTSGGPPQNNKYHLNPQFELTVGSDTNVIVFVRRLGDNAQKEKQKKSWPEHEIGYPDFEKDYH